MSTPVSSAGNPDRETSSVGEATARITINKLLEDVGNNADAADDTEVIPADGEGWGPYPSTGLPAINDAREPVEDGVLQGAGLQRIPAISTDAPAARLANTVPADSRVAVVAYSELEWKRPGQIATPTAASAPEAVAEPAAIGLEPAETESKGSAFGSAMSSVVFIVLLLTLGIRWKDSLFAAIPFTAWRRDRRRHAMEDDRPSGRRLGARGRAALLLAVVLSLSSGCASLTNPVLNGIPVRRLPTELLSTPRREQMQTVPLSLLQQQQPDDYVLGAGDVIGVFIPGVFPLTLADQALPTPPVYFPSQIDPLGAGLPPSLGYPVTIQNDGRLTLPLVEPVMLEGLTVEQAKETVRSAYEERGILQPGREAVLVTLMQPRQIRILVFRQEVGGFSTGGRGDISGNNVKLGTGHIVDLRAYENDILTALAKTGGMPGLDAFDGIFIFRGGQSNPALTEMLQSVEEGDDLKFLTELDVPTDYIPTRWPAGDPLPFNKEDILLQEGDVVMLENRSRDFFYTGGLLPSGQRVLPRDYDLDVLEAVAQVNGTLVNGAFGGNNFNGLLIQRGIGNPNPSALTVIRRTPEGAQIPIRVDLNRALTDPRERIVIQPDDVLILQETRGEAFARYLNDIFNFNVTIFQRGTTTGTATAANPVN
jgi:hypothetical protein